MCADYYITKHIFIEYTKDGQYCTQDVGFYRKSGYFIMNGYDSGFETYKDECIKVTYKPRTLYVDGAWISDHIKKKYSSIVKAEINGGTLNKVIKYEERQLR